VTLNIYTHADCLEHILFPFFAEKPERLKSLQALFNELSLQTIEAPPVDMSVLRRIHSDPYIGTIRSLSQKRGLSNIVAGLNNPYVQWYTHVSPGSYQAALQAAGSVTQAVKDTLSGACTRAFCAGRPPGHHAGPERGEGFCLFNNVAAGAVQALQSGVARVAIIDFDRHHGNGTQDIIEQRLKLPDNILFVSSYQQGCKYDHNQSRVDSSGWVDRNLLTVAVPENSSYQFVHEAYESRVIPALYDFKPELILLSAGFDMHKSDPLSSIRLESVDYRSLTELLVSAANDLCGGRVVSVLEGGYDLKALKECVGYHLQVLQP